MTLIKGRYRILETIGRGGFGETYLTVDEDLPSKRKCVVKQLKPQRGVITTDMKERFAQEARVLEWLSDQHDRIPRLFAYFEEGGEFYLVQEYVPGKTVGQLISERMTANETYVRNFLLEILPTLEFIHSKHILHRDIKPANIIIRESDGMPVLIDFGLVKGMMDSEFVSVSMAAGTIGFMAMEQFRGNPTKASDIYSLGMTAIAMLTPDIQLTPNSETGEIDWKKLVRNGLSDELGAILDKATAFKLSDRYRVASEMLKDIENLRKSIRTENSEEVQIETKDEIVETLHNQLKQPKNEEQESPIIEEKRELQEDLSDELAKVSPPQKTTKADHSKSFIFNNVSEAIRNPEEEKLLNGLLSENELKNIASHMIYRKGSRQLLTGYGSFGATSLIKASIVKAKQEIKSSSLKGLITIYFEVDEKKEDSIVLTMYEINRFKQDKPSEELERESQLNPKESVIFQTKLKNELFSSSLKSKIIFNKKTSLDEVLNTIKNLQNTTPIPKTKKIVSEIFNANTENIQVTIIIDKILKIETLENLSEQSPIFRNPDLTIIAVARRESVDRWGSVFERLEKINFQEWYITSVWGTEIKNLISKIVSTEPKNIALEDKITNYFEFHARGSIGNIINFLKASKAVHYTGDRIFLDENTINHEITFKVQYWIQKVLNINWDFILSDDFRGQNQRRKEDRAKCGVYSLIDWIARQQKRFTLQQAIRASQNNVISISPDPKIRCITVQRLFIVLIQNQYIKIDKDDYLKECLNSESLPVPNCVSNLPENNINDLFLILSSLTSTPLPKVPSEVNPSGVKPPRSNSMVNEKPTAFISYSHADKELKNKLQKHLSLLNKQAFLATWHDEEIPPGGDINQYIKDHLNSSEIILLLVSADFLSSDYCETIEIKTALQRHEKNEAIVIPIILRACDWTFASFGKLKALPEDGKPVTSKQHWQSEDDAFLDIARSIRKLVTAFRDAKS